MFKYFRELLYILKQIHNELKEVKMLLIMFIGANGLSNLQIQDLPKPPTDDEIKKDGGYIINPSGREVGEKLDPSDFFSYHGPIVQNTEEELFDASELPSTK